MYLFGLQPAVLCDNFSRENYTLVISKLTSGVVMEIAVFPGNENILPLDKLEEDGVYELVINISTGIGHVSTSPRNLCKSL